jgi:hypothetical protein
MFETVSIIRLIKPGKLSSLVSKMFLDDSVLCSLSKWYCENNFFPDTMTADHYLNALHEEFLQVMGVNFRETFCNGISHDHML